jgi:SAM-dependent methyltransferase
MCGRVYARLVEAGDRPEAIVRRGYDEVALRYLMWRGYDETTRAYVERVASDVPEGGLALDLGCGSGIPVTSRLAERASVVGVDLSWRQLWLARQHVPEARFVQADVTTVGFRPSSFDAVTAVLVLNHVPRDLMAALLESIHGWLRPAGRFMASMGATDDPDNVQADWLGAPMFFSSFDADTNLSLVRAAGFVDVDGEVIGLDEDGQTVSFLWVTATRPG